MKNHLFLNTHKISVDGKPLETLYFKGDADIAYGWQVAQTRKLTDAEKEWFIQLRNHELLEKNIWMKECLIEILLHGMRQQRDLMKIL
ncbi:hypothetical protein Clocl_1634 [Acetivibrio clariflavus DSM 19732]|uniref:Uncharacterized protein n=1 Tax=Acetivibrio clariflavus (strain DSM 19732 / NBRC 101661 / EBR45) TaxID=720554 RepID=G8LSF5_ACECE|nr:hypothetical protein Clocl_1634 [Acetivibrio clariflavus DSM 19732]